MKEVFIYILLYICVLSDIKFLSSFLKTPWKLCFLSLVFIPSSVVYYPMIYKSFAY